MQITELANDEATATTRYFNRVSDDLSVEGLAMNYFERGPGESVGDFYHRHHEQEEVFVVLSGTATFETEDGEFTVEAGQAIRFGSGEWQQGWNRGEERLRVLAMGAPQAEGETDLQGDCPDCGTRRDVTTREKPDTVEFVCGECEAVVRRYP